jgi:RimJ/RimL family protein N-acetyltransferase
MAMTSASPTSYPRPYPRRERHIGRSVCLEPLGASHVPHLWLAATDAEASWKYLRYGPFESPEELGLHVAGLAARSDQLFFAIIPVSTGRASGWASYCDIYPADGSLEIGSIWLSPLLRRTRASTEAMYLLLQHAFDDLGYQRVVWRCNAENAASVKAAERLGFTYEGTWRSSYMAKGRRCDARWHSLLAAEWPARRAALEAWLTDANFDVEGRALSKLDRPR